jgi:hypothetical protein
LTIDGSIWPERPYACVAADAEWVSAPQRFDESDGVHLEGIRMCSHCHCIHPEDLYDKLWLNEPVERPRVNTAVGTPDEAMAALTQHRKALQEMPVHLAGTPWSAGWPHKFLLRNVPNGCAGELWIRRDSGPTPPMGSHAVCHGDGNYTWVVKSQCPQHVILTWFSVHLMDLEPEAFALLAEQLQRHTGIRWTMEEAGLAWEAPHYNYYR